MLTVSGWSVNCVQRDKHETDVHRPAHDAHLRPDHQDDITQSPSLRILESRFVYGEGQEESGHGVSDF